jgi:protein-disulfide isomerase
MRFGVTQLLFAIMKGTLLRLEPMQMPFCCDRVQRIALALTMMNCLCLHAVAQPAKPRDAELSALRQEVQQLKTQQKQMLSTIEEIKQLLSKGTPAETASDAVFTTEVAEETFKGSPTATLVIIEYGDFECQYCRDFENDTFPQIRDAYISTGGVRFYFRDLPLRIHPFAMSAAQASRCATEQGGFWRMHDELFAGPPKLTLSEIDQHAKNIGLDVTKLHTCVAGDRYVDTIRKSIDEAARMGIRATPTFLVGHLDSNKTTVNVKKLLVGSRQFTTFKEIFDPLIAARTLRKMPKKCMQSHVRRDR